MSNHCTHSRAHIGLDTAYCPDCQQTFDFGSETYGQILKRGSSKEPSEDTECSVTNDTQSSGGFKVGNAFVVNNTHSHQFTPVWQSDCTLVSRCSCGEKRECNINELQELLRNCIIVRSEYLLKRDKSSSKSRQQEFARAIADKDKQIAQVKSQMQSQERLSEDFSTSTPTELALDEIRRDGGTQPRTTIDLKHVKLLEEQMEEGKELEPVTVFYDGESYWLADGFHRFSAHRNQGREAMPSEMACPFGLACIIHTGLRRDAVLYSVGANADHKPALPRNREDKRRAVMTLLQDSEWKKWSDREIAQHCRIDHKTVGKSEAVSLGNSPVRKNALTRLSTALSPR